MKRLLYILLFLPLGISLSLQGQPISHNGSIVSHQDQKVSTGYEPVDPYPAPAILSNADSTFGWYQVGDFTTDVGVDNWNNATGTYDLVQATTDNQPLFSGDTITLGANDEVNTGDLVLAQPVYAYMIARQNSYSNGDDAIGGSGLVAAISQINPSPNLATYSGAWIFNNTDMTIGDWHVVRYFIDGINSKLQIDEETASTGDMGTGTPSGWRLGFPTAADWSFLEVIIMETETTYNEDSIFNYLYNKLPE